MSKITNACRDVRAGYIFPHSGGNRQATVQQWNLQMQVSQAVALLDDVLEAWRNRPLGVLIFLYLDVLYEKVRLDGQIGDAAVLIASWAGL